MVDIDSILVEEKCARCQSDEVLHGILLHHLVITEVLFITYGIV